MKRYGFAVALLSMLAQAPPPPRRGPRVVEHVRICGSVDVYLIAYADGWYLVEGVELSEDAALEIGPRPGCAFTWERDAYAAFSGRVGAG